METRIADRNKRQENNLFKKKLSILSIGGAIAFWMTSILTSLLPIAAEYRAVYSNWSIQTVWFGSLFAGLIFGCCVSYSLLRFFAKIPEKNLILRSVILSSVVFILAIVLIDVPMIFHASRDALPYFFIGVVFNGIRFLFLGITIGYLYRRFDSSI